MVLPEENHLYGDNQDFTLWSNFAIFKKILVKIIPSVTADVFLSFDQHIMLDLCLGYVYTECSCGGQRIHSHSEICKYTLLNHNGTISKLIITTFRFIKAKCELFQYYAV